MSLPESEQPAPTTIGAPDPTTGMPMAAPQLPHGAGGKGSSPEADPDAQGLPPHVVLPEAEAFKRDQLRARLMVSLIALALLGVMVLVSDEYRQMYALCAGGASLAVLVLGVRYVIAKNKAARQEESTRSKNQKA